MVVEKEGGCLNSGAVVYPSVARVDSAAKLDRPLERRSRKENKRSDHTVSFPGIHGWFFKHSFSY